MSFPSWLPNLRSALAPGRRQSNHKRRGSLRAATHRLHLETLEDRCLMAFNALSVYATGSIPVDLALAPIDAGSRPDLIVANGGDGAVSVRLGNADGTFGTLQPSSAGANPRGMAVGELTGDGVNDLVTAGNLDPHLLRGNGDGTFQPPISIVLPSVTPPGSGVSVLQNSSSVATGDLNHDGNLDLVVTSEALFDALVCDDYGCSSLSAIEGYANVLLGNGSGGFGAAAAYELGLYRLPTAVTVADVDLDGEMDVLTANSGDLSVLKGEGTGALGVPSHSGSGYGFRSISLGDVDGDGKLDTLLSNETALIVQKGDGQGSFTAGSSLPTGSLIDSAVLGDVNADGKLDLVAVGSLHQFNCTGRGYYGECYSGYYTAIRQARVLIGNGLGNFAVPLVSSLGTALDNSWLADVAVIDRDGDGLGDLVTIDAFHNEAIVATNDAVWNSPASISIADATIVEGDSGSVNLEFTVTIKGSHGSVSVNYATANNSATAGSDYTSKSGTLMFGASEFSKTVSIPILGDTLDEYDEQFLVNLSNAVGNQITDSQGIGTIVDDDAAPLVKISDVSKNEGNGGTTWFVFTVSLSAASGKQVSVNFATADGTATVAGNDYFAASGTIVFAPGQKAAAITILVRGDTTKEANETFFVNLTGATNGTIADSQGMGTIVNDDGGGPGGGKRKLSSSSLAALLTDDTWITTRKRR